MTALDIATARARHATWLQGVRPIFLSADEASQVCTDVSTTSLSIDWLLLPLPEKLVLAVAH